MAKLDQRTLMMIALVLVAAGVAYYFFVQKKKPQPCPAGMKRDAQGTCIPIVGDGCPAGMYRDQAGTCIPVGVLPVPKV